VDALLRGTIGIDPNHREARRLLGYVPFEGQWILRQQREEVVGERENRKEPAKKKEPKRIVRRPVPEVSPGYVYFGIPPSIPPRGSQNYGGYGYGFALP